MEDSTKGTRLKIMNPKKRRILHARNIIPVMRHMPFNQSYDTPLLKNRQNYKNNALLFSETPLRILYDSLEKFEVRKPSCWKDKNQSTEHTLFGRIESSNIKKVNILQNLQSSKRLSHKEKIKRLSFPNTVLPQSEPLINDKDLHKASSTSIKLSRKRHLSQIKENQTKYEEISMLLPKIETPSSSITNKPDVSLPSQSFYDIADSISTNSTHSSSFKIENEKTSVNIANKGKSILSIASNHLHSSNSEYEINVLHYENDILVGNNFLQSTQTHLKSTSTDCSSAQNKSSAKIQNDDNLTNKKNSTKNIWNENKTANNVKHNWAINNWMLSSQKKELDNICEIKTKKNGPYDCKIKYSWQIIGISTQTSYTLLQDLLYDMEDNKPGYNTCTIKYSWQVIGISTQTSLHDYNDPDYWSGILLTPNKNYNKNEAKTGNNHHKLNDYTKYPTERLKKCLVLNNQQTQTFTEKEIQADPNDRYAKYSWHNLIKQYL